MFVRHIDRYLERTVTHFEQKAESSQQNSRILILKRPKTYVRQKYPIEIVLPQKVVQHDSVYLLAAAERLQSTTGGK